MSLFYLLFNLRNLLYLIFIKEPDPMNEKQEMLNCQKTAAEKS